MNYWLMKSEPSTFSIDDLKTKRRAAWDGVRNYQARNFMRDMKMGDLVLFYHSSVVPPGVAGIARVCKQAYPDFTAWDKKNAFYDPRSTPTKPVWFMVDVEFVTKFNRIITLEEIRNNTRLEGMLVLKKGTRLSVQPVKKDHFLIIESIQ